MNEENILGQTFHFFLILLTACV